MTYIWILVFILIVVALLFSIIGSTIKNKDMHHLGNLLLVFALILNLYFSVEEGEGTWSWTFTYVLMIAAIITLTYSSMKYFLKDRK